VDRRRRTVTAELVSVHAAKRATRYEALEPLRQGIRRCFGAIAENVAQGLALRHDHGSQYLSEVFQASSHSSASNRAPRLGEHPRATAAPSA
jgi:hypothetical protein